MFVDDVNSLHSYEFVRVLLVIRMAGLQQIMDPPARVKTDSGAINRLIMFNYISISCGAHCVQTATAQSKHTNKGYHAAQTPQSHSTGRAGGAHIYIYIVQHRYKLNQSMCSWLLYRLSYNLVHTSGKAPNSTTLKLH